MFARLDLDGRGGVLEAEEEASRIFKIRGCLCALIAGAQKARVGRSGEDLEFETVEGSGEIDGRDVRGLRVDGESGCHGGPGR